MSSDRTYEPVASHEAEADESQFVAVEKKPQSKGIHASLYIVNWIVFSNATILFNKWLIDSAGFRYPILLTCWHLIFATAATQLLARTTTLLDSRKTFPLTGRLYIRTIMPIGLVYSGSLVCSNLVYLYLSVSFIQMLKSAAPVAVLFASWAWGVADPSLSKLLTILVIVFGVAIASFGEIDFSLTGFLFQVAGISFEAVRLVMIQVMLSGEGMKMDPMVGLYYYAPICAVMNLVVAAVSEIPHFEMADLYHTGFTMLILNALVAFMLNVASVFLIGKTSGLVMTLSGILKNILLIGTSVIIWNTPISGLQAVGYLIALGGLTYYSLGYDQCMQIYRASVNWAANKLDASPSTEPGISSARIKKMAILAAIVLFSLLILAYSLSGMDVFHQTDILESAPGQ